MELRLSRRLFDLEFCLNLHDCRHYDSYFNKAVDPDSRRLNVRMTVHWAADRGLTAVRHTHSRRLDYHPHDHVIVPGGGRHLATDNPNAMGGSMPTGGLRR